MSISKRSLIFVFAVVTAFLCFAHDRESVAQPQVYRGLEMPDVYYLTQKPYEPTVELKGEQKKAVQKAVREALTAWGKEGGNKNALSAIRKGKGRVRAMLTGGGDATTDPEARKFLDEYTFPSMTQTDADTLSSLGAKRQDFLKDYLNERVKGAARSNFLDLTVEKLRAYSINPKLHPSARVSSVALLSRLTDRPVTRNQTPIASAKAFNALLGIYGNADPKQNPEFVKTAALSGIKHQLDINTKSGQTVDAAVKSQLVEEAMKFMAAPTDREKEAVAYWNKRQAVQLSGILKDAKTMPSLLAILSDETSNLELKLEVVRAIAQTGAMDSDAKANGTVLAAICKFAETAIAGEATGLQDAVNQMVRDSILFGGDDVRETGSDTQPENEEDAAARGGFGGPGGFGEEREKDIPLVELPNYQLANARNRIRAVAMFCRQAIGTSKQAGLRPNLDAKAETLASDTVRQLSTLLTKANVGLLNLDERRRDDEPSVEEEDRKRETSYVDKMIKVCETTSGAITELLTNYAAE